MPERVQRTLEDRTEKPNTVYVGALTEWGSPFKVGDKVAPFGVTDLDEYNPAHGFIEITPANVLTLFEMWARERSTRFSSWLAPLRGKDLSCWCKVGEPCHADVLLKLANEEQP